MSTYYANVAQDTLKILATGIYMVDNKEVNIKKEIQASKARTKIINLWIDGRDDYEIYPSTKIEMFDNTTLGAAYLFKDSKTVILNFASAKNPGGGFIAGSVAQEESIAFRSSLYTSLSSVPEFYEKSKRELHRGLYNGGMIYSKDMIVFKDEQCNPIKPWTVNCITSAAVNRRATTRALVSEKLVQAEMYARIKNIILLAREEGNTTLILGAYGCGIFKNDPYKVAYIFYRLLVEEHYASFFTNIIFAIPGAKYKNYVAFKETIIDRLSVQSVYNRTQTQLEP